MTVPKSTANGVMDLPSSPRQCLKTVGPGLVLAAAAIGSGDLVTSLVAGDRFGTALLWAFLLAALVKFFLTEGLGRWYLGSGQTVISGWHSLGRWITGIVALYLLLWAISYGAAGPSVVGLAAHTIFPFLPTWAWAITFSIFAFLLVWIGRYGFFEKIMKLLIVIKFICIVGIAVAVRPNLTQVFRGFVPSLPEGSMTYALAVMGGFGGTATLVSYSYWVRDKGWRSPRWIPVMRADALLSYVVSIIFATAAVVVAAEFLAGPGLGLSDAEGLGTLATPLGEQYGAPVKWLFLIGFWAIGLSAVVGTWNGIAYLFADVVRVFRRIPDSSAGPHISEKSPAFRVFLVLITFPPIPLIVFGRPVFLLIGWAIFGALFMPFLAATLLRLLNSSRVSSEYRNRILSLSNIVLAAGLLLFIFLGVEAIGELL